MGRYDPTFAIEPQLNDQGVHLVWASVVWQPREGVPTMTTGNYLFADRPDGTVYLHDGADDIAEDLGLWELWDNVDAEHIEMILTIVNQQLRVRSWAMVLCAFGELRIELVGRR